MKNKSLFIQILLLVIVSFFCLVTTICIAFLAGSVEKTIFDLSNLNIGNMIPVFVIGGLISCFIIVITLLFTSKTLFYKIKDFLEDNNKENKN